MPQYSSTATTPSGIVINTVYDTEASTLTYTATAQNGTTVTATQQTTPSASAAISSDTTSTIYAGLNAAGANLGTPSGFNGTLRSTQTAVKAQASEASRAAQVTNTPVPDAPAPPPSTNNAANPEVAPAPNNTPPIENAAAPATGIAGAVAAAAAEQVIQDKKQADLNNEFAGIDEQVAQQKNINENTTGQAVVAEDGTVNPNIKVNPETGELYVPVGDAAIDDQIRQQAEPETVNPGPKEVTDPAIKRVEDAAAEDRIAADEAAQRADAQNTQSGLTTAKADTQSQATQQDVTNAAAQGDWRVRLSLAPGSNYLYNANPPGILAPLSATGGVIFPYTPSISVTYAANYDSTDLTHTNYRYQSYKSSAVDAITIGCDFTAQDAYEANYILAVIHFFRSITKMFYGQDPGPVPGTPPPLCYLTGLGAFQFDQHPLLIQNFTYTLPTDVDYIAAGSTATQAGVNRSPSVPKSTTSGKPGESRMAAAGVQQGAIPAPPNFSGQYAGTREPTYVPTKISLSITALPVVTRNDVSNRFSLKDYATGALLRSSKTGGRGGFW